MKQKGIVLSFVTMLISGLSVFANGIFVARGDPLIFALVRNACATLVLTMLVVVSGLGARLITLKKKEWGKLAFIGAIGGGIPFALFFTGLSRIGAINGNILHKTLFLWVAILAIPILKERITRLQAAGYAALMLGMFVWGKTFTIVPDVGTWMILGATILWAVENIFAKMTLKSVPPLVVSWGRLVFGLPFLGIATVMTGKIGLVGAPTAFLGLPVIVSTLFLTLYVVTWYSALSKAPATLVSSVLTGAPIVTALAGAFILSRPVGISQSVNLLLIGAGIVFIVIERMVLRQKRMNV